MPGNKQTVNLFNAASTCINYVGTMDGIFAMGLNWSGVNMIAEVLGVKLTPGIIGKLKALEAEYTKRFNNKKKTTPATKGGNA